jgi:hypothetical protein
MALGDGQTFFGWSFVYWKPHFSWDKKTLTPSLRLDSNVYLASGTTDRGNFDW